MKSIIRFNINHMASLDTTAGTNLRRALKMENIFTTLIKIIQWYIFGKFSSKSILYKTTGLWKGYKIFYNKI